MSTAFTLRGPIGGFAATHAEKGERAEIIVSEIVSSFEGAVFTARVEALQNSLFSCIPGLPSPSQLDHLLVVIRPTLDATAYINELQVKATIVPNRNILAGEAVYERDIRNITSVDFGVDIPRDCGFVLLRSHGWRRSLAYDFGPLNKPGNPRGFDVNGMLASQAISLIRGRPGGLLVGADAMKGALLEFNRLLEDRCEQEARYQQFLERNPWILQGFHSKIERHTNLDDGNIPDFTGVRHHDNFRDIVELKQPFLELFRKDGEFTAAFHDAWTQAERYLVFCRENRDYLSRQKSLSFENPKVFLIAGNNLSEPQRRAIRQRESMNSAISFLTYQDIAIIGKALLRLVSAGGG